MNSVAVKKSLRRIVLGVLLLGHLVYGAACCFVGAGQRRLIYFPPSVNPAVMNQIAAEEQLEQWTNAAGEPIGWKRPALNQPSAGQVLITYGNGGLAVYCAHYADALQQVANLDVFIVDYPGYAGRPGTPTEISLQTAAAEALELLPADRPTYLLGESLGTGVACYLAGRYSGRVSGVVLLAPYNTLVAVAQNHMRIFPVSWILLDRFPSEDYLRNYKGPVAMLVAGRDRVVPARFGRRLYDGYKGPKKLWEFPDGDHGTVMIQPADVWKEIYDFWQANRR